MKEILITKFHKHLQDSHPELVLFLQEENKLTNFLEESVTSTLVVTVNSDGPTSYLQERCLTQLKESLPPSKFHYLKNALEQSFPKRYEEWEAAGILFPELLNLITWCDPVFEGFGFTAENEDAPYLRYLILGTINEYLNKPELIEL